MLSWRDWSPRQWQELVNREVCVTTRDQQRFSGRVFTVDPVSASVVLVSFPGPERAAAAVQLVMGQAVSAVQVLSEGTEETERRMRSLLPETQRLSADELRVRRDELRLWLEQNRIPVSEDGELLRVAGALTISAPYGPGDCSCANQIILARVQSLLESCPHTH